MEYWNIKCLTEPPEISVKYNADNYKEFVSSSNEVLVENFSKEKWVREVRKVISNGVRKIWESDDILHREREIMRSFLYHRKNSFRSEKFLQHINKIMKCLRNWSELQIGILLFNMMEMIPLAFDVVDNIYMPTFQRMHFFTIKLVSGLKLLSQTALLCISTSKVLRSKILAGHSYLNIYLLLGFVARIRALCLHLANNIGSVYMKLSPLISKVVEKSNLDYPKMLQNDLDNELNILSGFSEQPVELEYSLLGGILNKEDGPAMDLTNLEKFAKMNNEKFGSSEEQCLKHAQTSPWDDDVGIEVVDNKLNNSKKEDTGVVDYPYLNEKLKTGSDVSCLRRRKKKKKDTSSTGKVKKIQRKSEKVRKFKNGLEKVAKFKDFGPKGRKSKKVKKPK